MNNNCPKQKYYHRLNDVAHNRNHRMLSADVFANPIGQYWSCQSTAFKVEQFLASYSSEFKTEFIFSAASLVSTRIFVKANSRRHYVLQNGSHVWWFHWQLTNATGSSDRSAVRT